MDQEEITRWVDGVLGPVLAAELGKDGLLVPDDIKSREQFKTHPRLTEFNDLGQLALLSADADRIKEYVFESDKLPEIRGGSQILDGLNDEGIREVFRSLGLPDTSIDDETSPGCIAYAAGGSLLALVPPGEVADELCKRIERLYVEETGAATISCVYQELSPLELLYGWKPWEVWGTGQGKDFGEVMQLQGLLLRRRKQEKPARPFFETLPLMRRCASCGIRPAQEIETEPEPRHLCCVCYKKAKKSRQYGGKKEWTREFEGFLRKDLDALETRRYLAGMTLGKLGEEFRQIEGAQDISEIAGASRRGRYVGFIYADGNKVGGQIERSCSLQEYRNKSQALLRKTRPAVYKALRRHLQVHRLEREAEVNIHPFEIITIGGDDVLLIVPGDVALLIALDICRAFEEGLAQARSSDGRPLFVPPATMSAGVMIADAGNPIYFMRDLAEQLLKSAKQRSAEEDCGSTVDFLVLKSQSMLDRLLKAARRRPPLQWWDEEEIRRLTIRPVTLEEAQRLIKTVQVLRREGFSRGQLVQLREALRLGRFEASLHYLYQRVRYPDRLREAFAWIEQQWDFQPLKDPLPWQEKDKREVRVYQTFWEDVADLWDFVPDLPGQEWKSLEREIHPPKGGNNGD